ncbi:MAG: hypothetical protein EPO11_08195 [Gammaproteobacteria bacterium]|nr:MAG: hypothetical protein EPO11_08195 [Gammaproteobacteria bacterium]
MMASEQNPNRHLLSYNQNWGWLLGWGIAMMIVGLIAISVATFTTLLSVIFIGSLLMIGGIVVTIDSFKSWWRQWDGFILHLAVGIFYFIVGAVLVFEPAVSSIALTFILGMLYLIVGAFRLMYSLLLRLPRWGWSLFNGFISVLIGILILFSWPASGLFIIGLFVGVDLFVAGWVYVMLALAGRDFTAF